MLQQLLFYFVGSLLLFKIEAFAPSTRHSVNIVGSGIEDCARSLTSTAIQGVSSGNINILQIERRKFLPQSILASGALMYVPQISFADDSETSNNSIDPSINLPKITSKVYLDIKYSNFKEPKRIVIGLFGDEMPKAAGNFLTLCTSTDGPSYAGTSFYRVISDTSIQGGAIGKDATSGKSGTSSNEGGAPFDPDNYNILHSKRGLVSAVRNPNGSIDSRFFIQTEEDAGWADGRYAAFGAVLEEEGTGGMELVKKISRVDVKTPQNSPKEPVLIVGCGLL
jgi:cyclophilin family peptidyl-prolyl cis-trans isomerase